MIHNITMEFSDMYEFTDKEDNETEVYSDNDMDNVDKNG